MSFITLMWSYAWLGGSLGLMMVVASAVRESRRRRFRLLVAILITGALLGVVWTARYDGLEQAAALFVDACVAMGVGTLYLKMGHWVLKGAEHSECAVCGEFPDLIIERSDSRVRVVCPKCGTAGPWRYDVRDSMEAWRAGGRHVMTADEINRARAFGDAYSGETDDARCRIVHNAGDAGEGEGTH